MFNFDIRNFEFQGNHQYRLTMVNVILKNVRYYMLKITPTFDKNHLKNISKCIIVVKYNN